MELRYQKLLYYNFITHPQKDKLSDYPIALNGKTDGKGGGGKEKESLRANIASILKYLTAKEKAENDGKEEILYAPQSLIVGIMSGYYVPSMPLIKNLKSSIGRYEEMKYARTKEQREIDDSKTLAASAAYSAKFMEGVTTITLKKDCGKPNKYVSTQWPTGTPHWFGSFSDEGYMTVKTNIFLCANIPMIFATTAMGDKKD